MPRPHATPACYAHMPRSHAEPACRTRKRATPARRAYTSRPRAMPACYACTPRLHATRICCARMPCPESTRACMREGMCCIRLYRDPTSWRPCMRVCARVRVRACMRARVHLASISTRRRGPHGHSVPPAVHGPGHRHGRACVCVAWVEMCCVRPHHRWSRGTRRPTSVAGSHSRPRLPPGGGGRACGTRPTRRMVLRMWRRCQR